MFSYNDDMGTRIQFNCDYCGVESADKPSSYNRKKRHWAEHKILYQNPELIDAPTTKL